MLPTDILKDIFGRRYRLLTSSDLSPAKSRSTQSYTDKLSAYAFLKRLNVDEHFWQRFILAVDGGLSDITDDPKKKVSAWLLSGRVRVLPINAKQTLTHAPEQRRAKNVRGEAFEFTHPSELFCAGVGTQRQFRDVAEAQTFIESLTPSDTQLMAIAEVMDTGGAPTTHSPATSVTDATIESIGRALVDGDIVVVEDTANAPPPSTSSDVVEDAVDTPGNRKAPLAPPSEPVAFIKLVLSSWDSAAKSDVPKQGLDWKMSAPVSKNGTTDGTGRVDVEVPVGTSASGLEVVWRTRDNVVAAPVSAAAQATDYPIKIQHEHWEDTHRGEVVAPEEDDTVKWNFSVVELASLDNDDGLKKRLHNMGYLTGSAASTKEAVQSYQYLYQGKPNGSGVLDAIKDDLKNRHDNG